MDSNLSFGIYPLLIEKEYNIKVVNQKVDYAKLNLPRTITIKLLF